MSALPTLEERRDYKLARAIDCLRDAFCHLEDAKPMMFASDSAYERADRFSSKIANLLTGEVGIPGLADLAASVKGKTL